MTHKGGVSTCIRSNQTGDREGVAGSKGNTHEDCIHSRRQVGEFGSPSSADENRDWPKPTGRETEGERQCWEKRKKDGMSVVAVVAREHRRGREKKGERVRGRKGGKEREREREMQAGTFA